MKKTTAFIFVIISLSFGLFVNENLFENSDYFYILRIFSLLASQTYFFYILFSKQGQMDNIYLSDLTQVVIFRYDKGRRFTSDKFLKALNIIGMILSLILLCFYGNGFTPTGLILIIEGASIIPILLTLLFLFRHHDIKIKNFGKNRI